MRKLTLISPHRGENYTAADAVKKLLSRRNFVLLYLEGVRWESPYPYEDFDGYISLEVGTLPSLWGDSIEAHIATQIPFHRTGEGRYSFGCPFSSRDSDSDTEPEYYQEPLRTVITAWLPGAGAGDEQDEVWFDWDPYTEDPDQKEIQNLLLKVLKEALVLSIMDKMLEDWQA